MQQILESIISTKPTEKNSLSQLRNEFVGKVVDIEKLLIGSYKMQESNKPGWLILLRPISNGNYQLSLLISPGRRITMMTYANYLEIPDEGLVGWYDFKSMSSSAANQITKELSSAITNQSIQNEKYRYYNILQSLNIKDLDSRDIDQIDNIVDGLTDQSYRAGRYGITSVLVASLLREIDNITDVGVLSDIPFFCGRLRMKEEFYLACERAYKENFHWDDTGITNIGSVLCDSFQLYELAYQCFLSALKLNPILMQARMNLIVVTKRLMWKFVDSGKYNSAIAIGRECITRCDTIVDSTFFTMLALSYEYIEDRKNAKKYYKMAMTCNPTCQFSSQGIDRLAKPVDKSHNLRSSLLSLKWDLCPSGLREDFIFEKYLPVIP